MTESQCDAFRAVYDNRSLSKAANILYVSQPAVSKHIAKLEQELGVVLFERGSGGAEPTPPAVLFRNYLQEEEIRFRDILEKMHALSGAMSNTVRLGCPEIWNPCHIGRMISGFKAEYLINVEAFRLSELLMRLQGGRLDMVMSHGFFTPNLPGLKIDTISQTGCGILYSLNHFGRVRDPAAFRNTAFLLYDSTMERRFRTMLGELCSDFGLAPEIRCCSQISAALYETVQGRGVMLFSDWDSAIDSYGFGYCSLPKRMPIQLYYYPERLSDTGRGLLMYLKSKK